jgi:hypothetical protein
MTREGPSPASLSSLAPAPAPARRDPPDREPALMRLGMNHSSISLPEHRRHPCPSRFEDRDRTPRRAAPRPEKRLRRDSIPYKTIDPKQSRMTDETHTAAQ